MINLNQSDLCDYRDAYIVVKGAITDSANDDEDEYNNIRDKKIGL